jgi:hypothetical protein
MRLDFAWKIQKYLPSDSWMNTIDRKIGPRAGNSKESRNLTITLTNGQVSLGCENYVIYRCKERAERMFSELKFIPVFTTVLYATHVKF